MRIPKSNYPIEVTIFQNTFQDELADIPKDIISLITIDFLGPFFLIQFTALRLEEKYSPGNPMRNPIAAVYYLIAKATQPSLTGASNLFTLVKQHCGMFKIVTDPNCLSEIKKIALKDLNAIETKKEQSRWTTKPDKPLLESICNHAQKILIHSFNKRATTLSRDDLLIPKPNTPTVR